MHPDFSRIWRTDECGFPPSHDWRNQQVEQYRQAKRGEHPHSPHVLKWLEDESDEHVLGLLRYREHASADPANPYAWPCRCLAENARTGVATIIKAMRLAKGTLEQISGLLNIPAEKVNLFLALFWDIEPHLANPLHANDLTKASCGRDGKGSEGILERLLFFASWFQGDDGLMMMLTPHIGLTATERKRVADLRQKLEPREATCKAAGKRLGLPPWEMDGDRYLRRLRQLEALPPVDSSDERCAEACRVLGAVGAGIPLSEFVLAGLA